MKKDIIENWKPESFINLHCLKHLKTHGCGRFQKLVKQLRGFDLRVLRLAFGFSNLFPNFSCFSLWDWLCNPSLRLRLWRLCILTFLTYSFSSCIPIPSCVFWIHFFIPKIKIRCPSSIRVCFFTIYTIRLMNYFWLMRYKWIRVFDSINNNNNVEWNDESK